MTVEEHTTQSESESTGSYETLPYEKRKGKRISYSGSFDAYSVSEQEASSAR